MDHWKIAIVIIALLILYAIYRHFEKQRIQNIENREYQKQREIDGFYDYRRSMLEVLTYNEIHSERIQDFFTNCAEVEKLINELKSYPYKKDDLEIQYNFERRYNLSNFENVYRSEKLWRLRDVIERHARNAIANNNSTYKNSKERQRLVYLDFIEGINKHLSELDGETLDLFYEMEEKVFFSTDGNVPRFNSIEERSLPAISEPTSIPEVDDMSGEEFEQYCADLLKSLGYKNVRLTQGSGDQGVDILTEKDGIKYAIQCKCYSSPLSNKPIQEVHAGKDIYGCHVGVVLTNSTFTSGAIDAANRTNTLLWDRRKLTEMISKSNEKRA